MIFHDGIQPERFHGHEAYQFQSAEIRAPQAANWGATLLETMSKTNMAPENGWLGDYPFLLGQTVYFQGLTIHSREGQVKVEHDHTFCWSPFFVRPSGVSSGCTPWCIGCIMVPCHLRRRFWVDFKHQRWPKRWRKQRYNNVNYPCCLNNLYGIPTWQP